MLANAGGGGGGGTNNAQNKQALLANEKRRRRRESHNAVERRRRDNINEKISELATLIPECMLDPAASGSGGTPLQTPTLAGNGMGGDCDPLLAAVLPMPPSPGSIAKKEEDGSAPPQSAGGVNSTAEGAVVKANKGMILRKSVEYIRYVFHSFLLL